jgi:hypothetical protein
MTQIETLRALYAKRSEIDSVIEDKRNQMDNEIEPFWEKSQSIRDEIRHVHASYINECFRGKCYKVSGMPDHYFGDLVAFRVVGYNDENDPVLIKYIPVTAVYASTRFSGCIQVKVENETIAIAQDLFPDLDCYADAFAKLLETYCVELTDEEFDKFIMDKIHECLETNYRIITKRSDLEEEMDGAVDVLEEEESEDDSL